MAIQLRIFGIGLLVNAKAISKNQFSFWSKKKFSELVRYLSLGDENFEEFSVPENAKFRGIFAEEEFDLDVKISDEKLSTQIFFNQIYGPKIDQIKKIEVWSVGDNDSLLFTIERPQINSLFSMESVDEEINAYLVASHNNLLYIESEEGVWVHEFKALNNFETNTKIEAIATNCSFGPDIDEIIDDVCLSFIVAGNASVLVDADTENLGTIAFVNND